MENPIKIEVGIIVIATKGQSTTCGINYIRQSSILKVAKDKNEWNSYLRVFRNAKEEREDNWHSITLDKVRFATKIEEKMWNNEIYFIETVKTI